MQDSANKQRHAQPLCLRLPSSLESLLYLLHSCWSALTVLVAGMRSSSIFKALTTAAMAIPDLSSKAILES